MATLVVRAEAAAFQAMVSNARRTADNLRFHRMGEFAKREGARSLLLVTRRHGNAENVDTFGFFDVTEEAVFIFELVVFERRRFGAAGFDARPDEVRSVV